MSDDTIEAFMTRSVHTIGTRSPLTEAHRMMNEHAIRHLPVLEGGKLVGMLSQRDLHLIETLRDVDPKQVLVEEAMSQDAYAVAPETPLSEVARTMAAHKYGSAVVARGAHVLGIFTTTDALQALDTVLTRTGRRPAGKKAPVKKAPVKKAPVKKAPVKKTSVTKRAASKRKGR
jgi:acetoin utilization protein AcuB